MAARIAELARSVERAGLAAGAGGDPVFSEAISDCMGSWSASLSMLSESVGGLGGNLGAAGAAYADTDSAAIAGAATVEA